MATDDSTPSSLAEDRALLRAATELLEAGQYERLAQLLDRARAASRPDSDPIADHTLDLARRICLACNQSQADAEWHRQACAEATHREDQLREQLDTLLHLGGAAGQGAAAPNLSEPIGPPSIWRRLQSLLQRRPGPQTAVQLVGPEANALAAATSSPPPQVPERESAPGPPIAVEEEQDWVPPALIVYCLGQFRVYQDDHLLTEWAGLKAKCILKYLVANYGSPIVKDVLMDVFWPDADAEAARRNLHQAVYSLRRTFRQRRPDLPYVLFDNDAYLLNPDLPIWVDAQEFERRVQRGQRLEAEGQQADAMEEYGIAEGLYEGDYLQEDPYEDWLQAQRHRLQSMYMQTANSLSKHYVQRREHTAAIALCRKVLSLDDCCEEAHRRLMRCYLAQGQRHLAVRQYQACVEALREELNLAPTQETVALHQRVISAP